MITKALIRLRGCAGWSGFCCLQNPEDRFSRVAFMLYRVFPALILYFYQIMAKGVFQQDNGDSSIPRKTIKGSWIKNIGEKNSEQSIFVFDRTTNLQFSKNAFKVKTGHC